MWVAIECPPRLASTNRRAAHLRLLGSLTSETLDYERYGWPQPTVDFVLETYTGYRYLHVAFQLLLLWMQAHPYGMGFCMHTCCVCSSRCTVGTCTMVLLNYKAAVRTYLVLDTGWLMYVGKGGLTSYVVSFRITSLEPHAVLTWSKQNGYL